MNSKENGVLTIIGKPTFEYGSFSSQDTKLIVEGVSLICTTPPSFLRSQCEEFIKAVNPNQPVQVTFFKSKGVFGIRYIVLQSLQQQEKILLSSSEIKHLQAEAYNKQL